jgi:hypothetical protein
MEHRLTQRSGTIRRSVLLVLCAFFVCAVISRVHDSLAADDARTEEDYRKRCCVYVTSTKTLSNVVVGLCDGTTEKFEGLRTRRKKICLSRSYKKKEICCVWIKSGCNDSGDGPGYGEKIVNPGIEKKVHGENRDEGCIPHVTATFKCSY